MPPPSLRPVIIGFTTAAFVVFATTAPYIKILSETEPIRILRNDFAIKAIKQFYNLFSCFFYDVWISWSLFQDIKLILYIVMALILVTFTLYLIGKLLIYVLSLIKFSNGTGWNLGLKNIVQRGNDSILQIIIFGLSLLFLVVLAETRTDLVDSWSETLEEDTPNYFLFNIQEYNLNTISDFLEDEAGIIPDFTPLIRAGFYLQVDLNLMLILII